MMSLEVFLRVIRLYGRDVIVVEQELTEETETLCVLLFTHLAERIATYPSVLGGIGWALN